MRYALRKGAIIGLIISQACVAERVIHTQRPKQVALSQQMEQSKQFTKPGLQSLSKPASQQVKPLAAWTVMIYIQAKNNLAPFAEQNLRDIAQAGANPKINIVAQWEKLRESEAWRYQISHKQVIAKNSVSTGSDPTTKLVDFVKWCANEFPADHYFLLMWNHGTGPIDPAYGSPLRLSINKDALLANPRINVDGIFEISEHLDQAILVNEENKTYLSNNDLNTALKTITSSSVLGKKIDCIGFDACFMSSLETAYEIRNYARFMIASEELELARGWSYETFVHSLFSSIPTPEQLARSIVTSYGAYYKSRTSFCTQAAIDLSKIDTVKQSLDETIKLIALANDYFRPTMQLALQTARNLSQQFSARIYVDIHSFCSSLRTLLSNEQAIKNPTNIQPNRKSTKPTPSPIITSVINSLDITIKALESSIIENINSQQLIGARGLSIYFPCRPCRHIETSYTNCAFCKESLWKQLLDNMLTN